MDNPTDPHVSGGVEVLERALVQASLDRYHTIRLQPDTIAWVLSGRAVRAALDRLATTQPVRAGEAQREANAITEIFRRYQKDGAFTAGADVVGCGRITIAVGPNASLASPATPIPATAEVREDGEPADWAVGAFKAAGEAYAMHMGDPNDDGYDDPSDANRAAALAIEEHAVRALAPPPVQPDSEQQVREEVEVADETVDFLFNTLADKLGLSEWIVVEGSEDWHGDVSATLHRLLIDAGIIDDETGAIATLATPSPIERYRAGLGVFRDQALAIAWNETQVYWEASEDDAQATAERMCAERRQQWGDDGECDRDGRCAECQHDVAEQHETLESRIRRETALRIHAAIRALATNPTTSTGDYSPAGQDASEKALPSHPRANVRPAYTDTMQALLDAYEQRVWVWAQGCEIDSIQQRSVIGDSYNEGQRSDAAKARSALVRQIDALTTSPADQPDSVTITRAEYDELKSRMPWAGGQSPLTCDSASIAAGQGNEA